MEVIVGEFGIVVVPRDGADPDRIMNHSSILRKYKVSGCMRGWGRLREDLQPLFTQGSTSATRAQNVSRPDALTARWDEQ